MRLLIFTFLIFAALQTMYSFFNVSFAKNIPSNKDAKQLKAISGGDLKAKSGGTLTYEFYEPNHINPITFRQIGSKEILTRWIFETLLNTDIVTGDDIPNLAKKWEVSKDGKVFTFLIDERARWYDGREVTAEDVKFSFEVYKMKGIHSAFRKSQVKNFSKIEVLSKYKIRFVSKNRLFSNFEFLTRRLILPKHLYYYKNNPEKMAKNEYTRLPKGSGPYFVKSWKKGDRAILEKNKNYWGYNLPQNRGAYNFDRIVVRYIRDAQIAFERLKKGDLDYMPIRIGNTEIWRQTKIDRSFKNGKLKALAINSKLQQGYAFIGFNSKHHLFKDRRVRKALAMAMNRKEMINKALDGLANIPSGPLFSVSNFAGTFPPVSYSPESALKLLADAGWTDSDGDYILDKDGKKFKFTVIVPNSRIEKEMLFIQSYWKQIGVDASVKILEYSTWRQLQSERKFEAVSNGKSRSLSARNTDPYREWHSDNIGKGLMNYYGFNNPAVDKMIMEARVELDYKKRKKILDKVNDIIASEYLIIQYSEAKFSLHAVSSSIVLPGKSGEEWYPYNLGIKYWYKR